MEKILSHGGGTWKANGEKASMNGWWATIQPDQEVNAMSGLAGKTENVTRLFN